MSPSLPDTSSGRKEKQPPNLEVSMGRLSKYPLAMFQENSIETCIVSRMKQITSPGWMHEKSSRTWCTGKT